MLRLTLAMTLVLTVAACGSRLNPLNWFGGEREQRIEVVERADVPDPRPMVREVLSLSVDPVPQGAIIQATGLPPTQGYWEADLIEIERADGTIVFEFRILPPTQQTRQGTQRSREVLAGTTLSPRDLAGIRTVTVLAQENSRSVSRR